MLTRKKTWVLVWGACFCLGLLGCTGAGSSGKPGKDDSKTAQTKRRWTEIRIESHPKDWGFAKKDVHPNRKILGGHFSGGPEAVFVSESESVVTEGDLTELCVLVDSLSNEATHEDVPAPDQKKTGYASVIITFDDGVRIAYHTTGWTEAFSSDTVQKIWDIIIQYEVGYW